MEFAKDYPPIPRPPEKEPFELGITTRVMAQRQSSNPNSRGTSTASDASSSSKFLQGTSIPNSTAKKLSSQNQEINEHVGKNIKSSNNNSTRSLSHRSINSSPSQNTESNKSSVITLEDEELLHEMVKRRFGSNDKGGNSYQSIKTVSSMDDELKEKTRISRRTLELENAPEHGERRRSTLESIKLAIDQSFSHASKLMNADSFERNKMKNMQEIRLSNDLLVNNLEAPSKKPSKVKPVKRSSSRSSKGSVREKLLNSNKQDLQTQTSFNIDGASKS